MQGFPPNRDTLFPLNVGLPIQQPQLWKCVRKLEHLQEGPLTFQPEAP